ncbi:hypothetical protein AALB19_06735 [Oscillospiraceae bacterium 50-58]
MSDLSADQAATALARFANIAGTSSDDCEQLGSTIVALATIATTMWGVALTATPIGAVAGAIGLLAAVGIDAVY